MDDTPLRYIPDSDHVFIPTPTKPPVNKTDSQKIPNKFLFFAGVVLVALIVLFIEVDVIAPSKFPKDTVVNVSKGQTLGNEANLLFDMKAIKSPFVFKALTVLFGGGRGLTAGDYYLEESQNVITMAWRFSHSGYDLKSVRVTIPEGLNSKEIAVIFIKEKKFTHFDSKEFVVLATPYEGYLFPDTYLFLPNITAHDVYDTMISNYKKRVGTLVDEIKTFGRPIKDIINMASILEKEARTMETREVIAGILWKRLDQGMLLQVDASIVYLTGKKSGNLLSNDDFKIISPYNTYLNKGLPPTPISNPGLEAIRAAIHPIATQYYFYLTDPQGGFHPAVTYEGHLANRQKYLGL